MRESGCLGSTLKSQSILAMANDCALSLMTHALNMALCWKFYSSFSWDTSMQLSRIVLTMSETMPFLMRSKKDLTKF